MENDKADPRQISRAPAPITPLTGGSHSPRDDLLHRVTKLAKALQQSPDWGYWTSMLDAELREAVALSLGVEPRNSDLEKLLVAAQQLPVSDAGQSPKEWLDFVSSLLKRLEIAESHLAARRIKVTDWRGDPRCTRVELAAFAAWALSLHPSPWKVPLEFAEIAKPINPETTPQFPGGATWPDNEYGDGRSERDDNALHPRTENNYLRLIMAFAMHNISGFDPRKSSAAAKLIREHTQVEISEATLAEYVKAAYALQSREKG